MLVFVAWPTCAPVGWALKDEAKVQGWQKSDSGIVGLWGDKGGYGWIKGDVGEELEGWGDAKRKVFTLILVKIGVNGAIKKPRQAPTLAVAIYNCYMLRH